MNRSLSLLIITTLALNGCATMRDSVLLSGAIGGTAGGLIGNQTSNHSPEGTVIGAAIGAGVGGLLGYLAHKKNQEKTNATSSNQPDKTRAEDYVPPMTKSRIKVFVQPDTIQGNEFHEKHRVWILESTPSWSKE